MATHITQFERTEPERTILKVEGEMLLDDAQLLVRIVESLMRKNPSVSVVIELSDLSFLDSEAAAILRKLDQAENLSIDGMETFLQKAIDDVERQSD